MIALLKKKERKNRVQCIFDKPKVIDNYSRTYCLSKIFTIDFIYIYFFLLANGGANQFDNFFTKEKTILLRHSIN